MKKLFFIVGLVFLCSCEDDKAPEYISDAPQTGSAAAKPADLTVNKFHGYPYGVPETNYCRFAVSAEDYKNDDNIVISNLTTAFISIDGAMNDLALIETTETDVATRTGYTATYRNKDYEATIHVNFRETFEDGEWSGDGEMKVTGKKGGVVTKLLVGRCGCTSLQ